MELRSRIVDHIENNKENYIELLKDTVDTLSHLGKGSTDARVRNLLQRRPKYCSEESTCTTRIGQPYCISIEKQHLEE